MFIGRTVAQYKHFIICMHFDTMRIQVHICFYQFDLQSRTRLVKNLISKTSTFSMFLTRHWDSIWSATHAHVFILNVFSASSIIWLLNNFPQFPCLYPEVCEISTVLNIFVTTRTPLSDVTSFLQNEKFVQNSTTTITNGIFTRQASILCICSTPAKRL